MQTRQKNYLFPILTFCLGLALTLGISSCKDDDELRISEYDPAVHVYATHYRDYAGEWETFIDITTGNYDSIPGTRERQPGGINIPNGTAALTDFSQNRRIYLSGYGDEMIIQDLTTLEKTTIALDLPDGSSLITRPEFLTFGADNNTIYVFDRGGDRAIYVVDVIAQTLNMQLDDFPINGDYFEAMVYQKSTNDLFFFEKEKYYILDLDTNELLNDNGVLPGLFGFVQHPDNNLIYALTYPNADRVFRLARLERTGNEFIVQILSGSDLAIDQLSPNLQTIHTATNAYVCRGGATLENNIKTYINSIDLNTGELIRTVTLDGFELMKKLEGE